MVDFKAAREPGWYVVYRVPGLSDKEYTAGPYPIERLDDERRDIAGYDGVVIVGVEKR